MTRLGSKSSSFNIDPLTRASDRSAALGIVEASPATDFSRATPTSQSIIGQSHYLYAGEVITNIIFIVTTAGAGTAPTLIKAGVWDSGATPTCKAVSNDVSAAAYWTSIGYAVVPLSSPYTVPSTALYYLELLMNGGFATTALLMAMVNANAAMAGSVGSARPRLNRMATGRTDMLVNDTGAYSAAAAMPWTGWS